MALPRKAFIAIVGFAGSVTASAQSIHIDGFEESCFADADADRLSNCIEANLWLDPLDKDTDDDGLKDGDEVLGTLQGLDLPALGVNPRHKDLLVEIDWTDDFFECASHSHRPTQAQVEEVRVFYSQLPVPNPDGQPGINYIADHGQGGVFTGGNRVDSADGVVTFKQLTETYWLVEFDENRRGYFRYSMHAHRWAYGQDSSGLALGDHNLVTLKCQWNRPGLVRNTMIHELGHNLGLHHGGGDTCNSKPNYNSVMNYNHQFHGLDVDCDRIGDGIDLIGYSDGSRVPLDEAALVEADGVCGPAHPGAKAIDWNNNGVIDAQQVSRELACGESTGIVKDWNDVAALDLAPESPAEGGAVPPNEDDLEVCPGPPDP